MKPIILEQHGRKWHVLLDVDAARAYGAKEKSLRGYPAGAIVPVTREGKAVDLTVGGAPSAFTKDEAKHIAHMIGRYKLGFGDMVFAYTEERPESHGVESENLYCLIVVNDRSRTWSLLSSPDTLKRTETMKSKHTPHRDTRYLIVHADANGNPVLPSTLASYSEADHWRGRAAHENAASEARRNPDWGGTIRSEGDTLKVVTTVGRDWAVGQNNRGHFVVVHKNPHTKKWDSLEWFNDHGDAVEAMNRRRSQHEVGEPHHVADFNNLEDLIEHARKEGATHMTDWNGDIRLYFPIGGSNWQEAMVYQKGGYWHVKGPSRRTTIAGLPKDAVEIGGAKFVGEEELQAFEAPKAKEAKRGGRQRKQTKQEFALESLIKHAKHAGEEYAQEQIGSDHFHDWIREQMHEAEQMRRRDPSSVIPFDAHKIARNMLQQLKWDTHRDLRLDEIMRLTNAESHRAHVGHLFSEDDVARAFYEGFDRVLHSQESVWWVADEVTAIHEEMGVSETPRFRRRTRR